MKGLGADRGRGKGEAKGKKEGKRTHIKGPGETRGKKEKQEEGKRYVASEAKGEGKAKVRSR